IFDHHRRSILRLHVGRQDAGEQIGGAARAERHHNGDLPLRPILSARRNRQTDKERSECTEAGSHIETSWKRRVHKRLAWRRRWFNRATQVRDPSSPNSCLNRFFTTTGGPVPTGVDASPIKQWPAPGRLVSAGTHRLHLHCKGQGGPTLVLEAGMAG